MLIMQQAPQPSLSTPPCPSIPSPLFASSTPLAFRVPHPFTFPASSVSQHRQAPALLPLAVKTPKGFGPVPKKKKSGPAQKPSGSDEEEEVADEGDEAAEDDVVPEVVTDRMLKRIALTVGAPLGVGLLFFPLFYYMKVVLKLDFPEWIPIATSMIMFGTAGLGITYGVVSTSWDPAREGSLLGWKEAQANWPVFWQTLSGKPDKR